MQPRSISCGSKLKMRGRANPGAKPPLWNPKIHRDQGNLLASSAPSTFKPTYRYCTNTTCPSSAGSARLQKTTSIYLGQIYWNIAVYLASGDNSYLSALACPPPPRARRLAHISRNKR